MDETDLVECWIDWNDAVASAARGDDKAGILHDQEYVMSAHEYYATADGHDIGGES